ncbi:hypothetical protein CTM93_13020 [Photobacterium phosphoreum]|jgi:hypothetical protein|uniref:hypothetical protein n=1 Tax=Photobacterium TaxID=657 RepID=UPI0007F8843F|nr:MULTISPECIES: hypothetical protein [Photobacterium]MCD9478121.1 hypothetical protein [Photobacterium phosphoreum]MCD9499031.1 hypothetical protein [Photobacterium carnosum]MCD9556381.1 hypothetical protein [Photobacterium carnosum]OBU35434.1 hypothetical protein AYY24_02485 [Photobacterium phosphoreum]PSU82510.1 hypothetical protein CTM93_13020 [Photobacterium phosphoreum]
MKLEIPLNELIYNLLITHDLDGFSTVELRHYAYERLYSGLAIEELRQQIYRQIYLLTERGFLRKEGEKSSRNIRYYKTSLFPEVCFVPSKRTTIPFFELKENDNKEKECFFVKLQHDKSLCEDEYQVVLSEVEEFQRLLNHYPSKVSILESLHQEALTRLTELKGKISALTKVTAMNTVS